MFARLRVVSACECDCIHVFLCVSARVMATQEQKMEVWESHVRPARASCTSEEKNAMQEDSWSDSLSLCDLPKRVDLVPLKLEVVALLALLVQLSSHADQLASGRWAATRRKEWGGRKWVAEE